jgi:hypothetical protein
MDEPLTEEEIKYGQKMLDVASLAVMELHETIEDETGLPLVITDVDGNQYYKADLFTVFSDMIASVDSPDTLERLAYAMTASDVLLRGGTIDLATAIKIAKEND